MYGNEVCSVSWAQFSGLEEEFTAAFSNSLIVVKSFYLSALCILSKFPYLYFQWNRLEDGYLDRALLRIRWERSLFRMMRLIFGVQRWIYNLCASHDKIVFIEINIKRRKVYSIRWSSTQDVKYKSIISAHIIPRYFIFMKKKILTKRQKLRLIKINIILMSKTFDLTI